MSAPEKTKTRTTGQGRIVVISGPSGSGKTTVCDRLLAEPGFVLSVSATTRKPRPGERDGVTYHFMDRDEFVARAGRGEFAEHAEYNGHLYGTPREPLERAVAQDKTVLVEIDVQGAAQMRRQYPDAIYIFLDAPNDEAAARLELRNTETVGERQRRVDAARRERAQAKRYFDFRVVNDKLDEAVETVKKIIVGEQVAGTHL
jgi:guanylate kinase